MAKLHGNKGEWSEIYVLLYLLAVGRLYAANADLEKIDSVYYGILKIFRNEELGNLEFCVDTNNSVVHILNRITQKIIETIPMSEFKRWADFLFSQISQVKQASFTVPCVEDFLKSFHVETLKAKNSDKADIRIKIHDINTGFDAIQGFSIKSRLGSPSTLVNASNATNFIFEVSGDLTQEVIQKFNSKKQFRDKIFELHNSNCYLRFSSMENEIFECNLLLIDSFLPQICANLLLIYYTEGISSVKEALQVIEKGNPLNYDLSKGHPFYQYKFKKFLSESAVGMLPAKPWDGFADATGGYIVVKEDGEVLCYHLFNYNDFEQYLLNNTKFETPSTSRHKFGNIYEINGRYFVKLNMQIRFIK